MARSMQNQLDHEFALKAPGITQVTFPQSEKDKEAGEWYLAYAESKYAKAKRLDPTAWHQERLQRRADRKLKAIRESGYGSKWFDDWYAARKAKRLSTETLLSYMVELARFSLDPAFLTTEQIIKRLSVLSSETTAERYRQLCVVVRTVVRQLRGRDEADKIQLPPHGPARVVLLSKDEIQKMLDACSNIRDRLIIQFFRDEGGRRGEHANLKIKDIVFDEYSPIVWLRGKTGERRRRIYASKLDIIAYLKCHPRKDEPNAALWFDPRTNEPIQYAGLYRIIRRIGRKALGRNIYPHMFRHTAATADAKRYTDRELMLRHGWSSTSQIKVYTHLSMRDVDDKDLQIHGFNPISENQELLVSAARKQLDESVSQVLTDPEVVELVKRKLREVRRE
jgi:integrase